MKTILLTLRRAASRSTRAVRSTSLLLLVVTIAGGRAAGAQSSASAAPPAGPTRAELTAQLQAADRASATGDAKARSRASADAATLRRRLSDGDFSAGDRVFIEVRGEAAVRDTFVVRPGRFISIPALGDVPLQGVLRSELDSAVTRSLARYLREPSVRTLVFTRLLLSGEIARPGFYNVSPDVPLSDVIMIAGGPTPTSRLEKTVIKRGGQEVLGSGTVNAALRGGTTLDRLGIQAGDEVVIGKKPPARNLATVLTAIGVLSPLIYLLARR